MWHFLKFNSVDIEGMTPLHHAIFHHREKFAMTLIKIGWDLNIKDVRGTLKLIYKTFKMKYKNVKINFI